MPNQPHYACTQCKRNTPREDLTVKKAMFTEMGEGARTIRSRVVDWLCPLCLTKDTDYQREKFSPPRVMNLAV